MPPRALNYYTILNSKKNLKNVYAFFCQKPISAYKTLYWKYTRSTKVHTSEPIFLNGLWEEKSIPGIE